MRRINIISLTILLLIPIHKLHAQEIAGEKVGIVLMHGKWGGPRGLSKIARSLRSAGALVDLPTMPWSRSRAYAKTYDASMREIDTAIKRLRAKGAKRIIVGGHSMGANAALGYGAKRKNLTGVILLAPGHTPSMRGFTRKVEKSLQKARDLVASGRGNQRTKFTDINQGKIKWVTTTAQIYLSWFDPGGPAVVPTNARKIAEDISIFCADGSKEKLKRCGLIQSNLSTAVENEFVRVNANHRGVPFAARKALINWLRGL